MSFKFIGMELVRSMFGLQTFYFLTRPNLGLGFWCELDSMELDEKWWANCSQKKSVGQIGLAFFVSGVGQLGLQN